MYFERIYDEGLAQASYIVACPASEEAVVVDPLRDLDLYLDRLDELGFEPTAVAETHIHADFLSGGRDFARATGATLVISGEQGEGWRYEGLDDLDVREMADEEIFPIGGVQLRALHTPGHTPEHMSFAVVDTAQSDDPMMVLTGDFAFVGDLGRPDLLEKAAGEEGTSVEGAKQQYESVRDKLLELPDDVQIWPGHGAGSACGKALGSIPASTVGYERRNAWWAPYLEEGDVDGFVDELLSDQPESPTYFRTMKEWNRDGVGGGDRLPALPELTPRGYRRAVDEGALLVDTRKREAFAADHANGSVNLPSVENVSTYAGWVLPFDRPLVVHADPGDVDEVRRRLYRVGFTDFAGYIPRLEGYADDRKSFPSSTPEQVRDDLASGEAVALDVRSRSEYREGHVSGAYHAHYGRLDRVVDELPRDRNVHVYCGTGRRANIAMSLLAKKGFRRLHNAGGFDDLREAGIDVD